MANPASTRRSISILSICSVFVYPRLGSSFCVLWLLLAVWLCRPFRLRVTGRQPEPRSLRPPALAPVPPCSFRCTSSTTSSSASTTLQLCHGWPAVTAGSKLERRTTTKTTTSLRATGTGTNGGATGDNSNINSNVPPLPVILSLPGCTGDIDPIKRERLLNQKALSISDVTIASLLSTGSQLQSTQTAKLSSKMALFNTNSASVAHSLSTDADTPQKGSQTTNIGKSSVTINRRTDTTSGSNDEVEAEAESIASSSRALRLPSLSRQVKSKLAIYYLKNELKLGEAAMTRILVHYSSLLYLQVDSNLRPTVAVLRSFGFKDYDLQQMISAFPTILAINHQWTLP